MPRNLFERCEVIFPVKDAAALDRIHTEILPALMADTIKARLQQADGSYIRAGKVFKDAPPFSCQDFLVQLAEGKVDREAIPAATVRAAPADPAKPAATPPVSTPPAHPRATTRTSPKKLSS